MISYKFLALDKIYTNLRYGCFLFLNFLNLWHDDIHVVVYELL